MSSQKDKIYTLLSGLIIIGYVWILYNSIFGLEIKQIVCPIKLIAGIPCPSCGSTRSVLKLFGGDFASAIYTNPLGLVISIFLIGCPFWLLYDYVLKKDTLWLYFNKVETLLKNKGIALPLILVVLLNWIWNISKAL